MQAERLVALAPAVAGTVIALDDDRGDAKLPQSRTEGDSSLPTTDDQRVGLRGIAQLLRFPVAFFFPCRAVLSRTVLGTERPVEAFGLLVALEFGHGCQKRPDLSVA